MTEQWENASGETFRYAVVYESSNPPLWKTLICLLTRGRFYRPIIAFIDLTKPKAEE